MDITGITSKIQSFLYRTIQIIADFLTKIVGPSIQTPISALVRITFSAVIGIIVIKSYFFALLCLTLIILGSYFSLSVITNILVCGINKSSASDSAEEEEPHKEFSKYKTKAERV